MERVGQVECRVVCKEDLNWATANRAHLKLVKHERDFHRKGEAYLYDLSMNLACR